MYRLLSIRKPHQTNFKVLTHQREAFLGPRKGSLNRSFGCHCLCNAPSQSQNVKNRALGSFPMALLGIRSVLPDAAMRIFSTDHSLAPGSRAKKPRKKRKQTYTDLLQVTDVAQEMKTSVKSLKAHNLTKFIGEESSKFREEYQRFRIQMLDAKEALSAKLHEDAPVIFVNRDRRKMELSGVDLADILESYNHQKEIEEATEAEEIVEDEVVEPPVTVEFVSKNHRTAEDAMAHRSNSLNKNLRSYLEVCIATGMINRGLSTVLNYRFKYTNNFLDIDLYNVLISGYADKANWGKIREIVKIIQKDDLKMNAQTFAGILECLGRMETTDEVRADIESVMQMTEKYGLTVNDVIDRSTFVNDKRDIVLEAIQTVDKTFEPQYKKPHLVYSNVLVDSLNESVRPIEEKHKEVDHAKRKQYLDLAKQQLNIELNGYVTVKSVAKFPEPTQQVLHYRKKLDELNQIWHSQIRAAFHRDLTSMRAQASGKNAHAMNIYPYLNVLEVRQYADILLKEVRLITEGSETYSPGISQLYRDLGRKVQNKFQVERKKHQEILEKTGEIYAEYCDTIGDVAETGDNPRQAWQRIAYHNMDGPSLDLVEKPWPTAAQIGVGKFLYTILMRDLKVDTNVTRPNAKQTNLLPAFYTLFRYHGKLVKQEIKPHPVLMRMYRGSQQENLIFEANLVPMMCPPRPWTDENTGGYLLTKSDLIRLPVQAVQQLNRIEKMLPQNLYPSLDALNQLGNVPWKVNNDMLDVVLDVFNNGGSEKLDMPQPPSALVAPSEFTQDKSNLSKADKAKIYRMKLLHKQKQNEMYSLWCDALYRLSLANHFRDKVFWLPHNMDFRGRVYPIPPHLNHLGADLARSLLTFHDAKPLGVDGFMWLKLHCINLTGTKKRHSVRERLLYAEEVMDDILDSATNPLTGRMWWAQSDEPWQTLAACIEIAKVARSPNPAEYMSCFPIHQDGSCNGLQHYAALGRDTAGAMSVNLSPADVPQDVYSDVVALVERLRQRDAEHGNEVARILAGFVRRKVIKQTIMTTVYGVTRYGARLQIAKQLKDIDDFPQEHVWHASSYLTAKTFESLREMFSSTKEIQDWLTECARLISSTRGHNVEWCTPLGLPIVQPYTRVMNKAYNSKMPTTASMDMFERPNIMKQKNAFPPNFIHSLDSSHMMLTGLHCEKQGITFVSVHDCFWTHACTVPDMNKICREQFVALHSQPILEDLSEFLVDRYNFAQKEFSADGSAEDLMRRKLNKALQAVPQKGDFNLNNVLKSVYFFS